MIDGIIKLLFGVAPISVSHELATLINAKRVFIEQKRREDAGLLDEARVIKNRIAFNATEIAEAEREIEALEGAKAFLAGKPEIHASTDCDLITDMETRFGAVVEEMLTPKRAAGKRPSRKADPIAAEA